MLLAVNVELERLSTTDALTGLGNRRHFDDQLAREAERASRSRKELALVLLDVDHFKSYNDRYGHPEGDKALQAVGQVLRDCGRRPGDTAYRIGGEEFAVILCETDEAGALRVMRAIQAGMRALSMPHFASSSGILTLSQGATQVFGRDTASAIDRADAALYRAKRDGRDRIYVQRAASAA